MKSGLLYLNLIRFNQMKSDESDESGSDEIWVTFQAEAP